MTAFKMLHVHFLLVCKFNTWQTFVEFQPTNNFGPKPNGCLRWVIKEILPYSGPPTLFYYTFWVNGVWLPNWSNENTVIYVSSELTISQDQKNHKIRYRQSNTQAVVYFQPFFLAILHFNLGELAPCCTCTHRRRGFVVVKAAARTQQQRSQIKCSLKCIY